MPVFALQLKANLVNVTNLQPMDYADHRWYLKLKCLSCGEVTDRWQYATIGESHELSKGHGTAHILAKCSLCSRHNSLEILPGTYAPYSADQNEQFQSIVRFECRGLEPVEFDLRGGWRCDATESDATFEDITFNEPEWAEYDEKAGVPTEINEIESRFSAVKK